MVEPGTDPDPSRAVDAAIATRRSMRSFLPTPVSKDEVSGLLALASRAPSGSNIQPWKVRVVTGAALGRLTEALSAAHFGHVPEAREYEYYPVNWRSPYLERRRRVGWQLFSLAGVARGDHDASLKQRGRNYIFFGAPVGLIFTIDRDMERGSWLDYGMFLQTFMIAARARGLHTCPQAAIANYPTIIRDQLDVSGDEIVICGMALGHADMDDPVNSLESDREPVEAFVRFHSD